MKTTPNTKIPFLTAVLFAALFSGWQANAELVAHYPLEASAVDATGNGNDGVVIGAVLVPDRFGNPNAAYAFGSGSVIDCGNGPAFQFANSNFTICAWVYRSSASTVGEFAIFAKEAIYQQASQFRLNDRGSYMYFEITDKSGREGLWDSVNEHRLRAQLPVEQWTHVAVIRSGLTFTLMTNGHVAGIALTSADVQPGNTRNFLIGARHSNTGGFIESFPGIIDDVRIYNHALSPAEVWALTAQPCELIGLLLLDIQTSSLPRNKQSLMASLLAACDSFERASTNSAINQLEAFQHKVLAHVARANPGLAEKWIQAAQNIINPPAAPDTNPPRGRILHVIPKSGYTQVAVFDSATSQRIIIPGTLSAGVSTPTWSPDGAWFVFSGGPSGGSRIYKSRADGSQLTALTAGANNFVDPDWCSCGTKIAFQRAGGGPSHWMNADGTGLASLPVRLGFLRWSPDGTQLIGSNWGWESYNSTLSRYDFTTGLRTVITPYQSGQAYQRSNWSPDGQRLTVGKQNRTTLLSDVVIMNADGSAEVNLTADLPDTNESDPTWSPDGQWILFMSNAAGNWDIWAMHPDGTGKVNLTQSPENEIGPADFFPDLP